MPIHHQDFNYLRQLVRHHSAMVLDADKAYLAELRLTPLATQMGFSSLGEMIANLQTQPFNQRHVQVVEGMLLTETSFFRDRYPFDALANVILPELLAKRQTQRTLNIWCAACSSGQEPYSIAMLLHEEFPELANWKLRLIATDLSNEILNRAKAGLYSQLEVTRGLPLSLLNKYFQNRGNQWQICDQLRRRVEFQQLNLVTHSFSQFNQLDLIFLRNVLIYFDLATKKAVLEKIRSILAPDGYLFLGGGETTLNLDDSFERVQVDKAVCYRQRL
ncbi:MAG: protein-glutamate O-methyltransferase CheR [Coleofasciculus sp. C1-SOL-03]|uniref:CheR family methyltransferase n=1 Tax=Coleofasciculus sp. C1-SOL-03 TaxID=3069522 RepID=UPI0032FB454F